MFQDPRSSKSGSEWAIPQQSKLRYTQIFNQHDRNRTGFLTGLQCRNILLQSNLPQNILAQIWDLSDIDSDGQLTREEFLLAMHLTDFVKSGNKLPAELPADLIPPSYRRTRSISVASVVSSGSVSSSAAVDDAAGIDGTESVGSASSAKSVLGNNTFEDKRRENFEKGQAELERRRLQLLEQQRHEQEARQRKDREEAEKREKLRSEAEKKRLEELNRLQEKNRMLEAEKEEQKRQQLDKREQARRELERQRMAELETLRQQELLVQSQTAQEAMVHLRTQKQSLTQDMERLNEQYDNIRGSLNSTRMLVSDKKSKIDNMRSDRDTKMGLITSLRAQIKALVDRMAFLEKEETNLVAIARDLNLVPNSTQTELDLQAIQAKQASVQQMKDKINELINEKEMKAKDLESNKIILKETVVKLQAQTDAATEAYKVYQETMERAKVLREEYVKQSKIQAQDPDAIWNTKSGEDSWGNSDQVVKPAQFSKPGVNKTGITYKALYAFEARNIDELTINPGDIIAAVDTLTEPGWLSGELNGKTGWFPEAYVEKLNDDKLPIQDPFGQPIATKDAQQTGAEAFGFDSFSQTVDNLSFSNIKQSKGSAAGQISADPNKRQDSNATSNSDPSPSSAATTVVEAGLASDFKQSLPQSSMDDMREVFDKINLNDEFCLTLYPFESTETGDLAFTSDEYIKILKKEGDWWTGEIIGNPARLGMFPSNYVKPIEASEVLVSDFL